MSTPHPEHKHSAPSATDGSRSIHWRLWAAMLALALVSMAAGIYLTMSPLDESAVAAGPGRARVGSEAAASLLAREQAIEARLLVAAADPAMGRLADGINGQAERQLAARILQGLRGEDAAVVSNACIVRAGDGRAIPLFGGSNGVRACSGDALRGLAGDAPTDTVAHSTAGPDGAQALLLATPLRSVTGRDSGVLSTEVDVTALFDRSRVAGDDVVTSMLVDMGSSEVIASDLATPDPVGGVVATDLIAVEPFLEGIVNHVDEAEQALAAMGFSPTVVPLWSNGDGSRTGLVQLWSERPAGEPFGVRPGLLLMLAGAILAVIVLVRFLVIPFERMADSRAELQQLYTAAREDALNDALTGLGNHRAFQEELARQVTAARKPGGSFSLVRMDLDDLKIVNDREGHAAGDEMLRSMARTMADMARRNDVPFRTGGDEFAMILPDTNIDEAAVVAERILHFCKRPTTGARPSPFSAGISGMPWFTRDRDMVQRQADAALYWAKRHGRGTVEVYDSERDQLPDEFNDATGMAVQEVITGKLLRPVFQPIVDLRSGRVLGFEGLIRPDPAGPLPDTNRLFAAAAASGRTVELDLACIAAVIEGARTIGPDQLLTLNLSPRTLEVKDFDPAWLLSGLVRAGISPSRVILEVTEREEVDDMGRLQQIFNMLQQYGLRLAADDVGAGNAGLRLLSRVQFDIVKIDLSLVQDGVHRLGSRAVLQSLRDLALSQKARIVAEGVETRDQLQVIRELDIGAGQGFLLGRPDVSIAKSFVDVRQLESGVLLPELAPQLAWPTAIIAAPAMDEDEIPAERRAIFLPPARPALSAEGTLAWS